MKSKQKGNASYTFGFSRYETIAAFSNCIFLIISSFFLLISTFHNIEATEHGLDNVSAEKIERHFKGSKFVYLIQFIELIVTLAGSYMFADYALFAPLNKISN